MAAVMRQTAPTALRLSAVVSKKGARHPLAPVGTIQHIGYDYKYIKRCHEKGAIWQLCADGTFLRSAPMHDTMYSAD